jgi:hypothetical protein
MRFSASSYSHQPRVPWIHPPGWDWATRATSAFWILSQVDRDREYLTLSELVHVSVVETRQDRGPPQVDLARGRAGQGQHRLVLADGHEAAVLHREGVSD